MGRECVRRGWHWLLERRTHDGWLPAFPAGQGAIDSTATLASLGAGAFEAGYLATEEARADVSLLIDLLIDGQLPCGAWPFFPDEVTGTTHSTCSAIDAITRATEAGLYKLDVRVSEVLAAGKSWVVSTLSSADCAEIAIVRFTIGEEMSQESRWESTRRMLDAYDPIQMWGNRIERHHNQTVIRYATPYCIATLCGDASVPRALQFRFQRWLTDHVQEGHARLPGTDITSWPTRDALLAIARVRSRLTTESVAEALMALEGAEVLSSRAEEAMTFYARASSTDRMPWKKRLRRKTTILHLSDLHLGEYQRTRSNPLMADQVLRDTENLVASNVDFVVITGDLTSNIAPERELHPLEFESAAEFIMAIMEGLALSLDRLVVVPGNHDVTWVPESLSGRISANRLNTVNYRNFYHTLFGVKPDVDFFHWRSSVEHGIVVVGLNSCVAEENAESAWVGKVGDAQLRRLAEVVRDAEQALGGPAVKVAALHHHLVPVSYSESLIDPRRPISLTVDAEAVMRRLLQLGFDVTLHGHQHQPFVGTEGRIYGTDSPAQVGVADPFKTMIIHGAGSLGAPGPELGTISRNSYSLLVFDSEGVHLTVRQSHPEEPGAFAKYLNILIPRF
jgi:predicted phosphodiesterase